MSVTEIDLDITTLRRYTLTTGSMDIRFSEPLPRIPEKGEFLTVSIGDRVLFQGIVEADWKTGFRLVSPLAALLLAPWQKAIAET